MLLVLVKKSLYEKQQLEKQHRQFDALKRKSPTLYQKLRREHDLHHVSIDRVIAALDKKKIKYVVRTQLLMHELNRMSMILAVGGDGTFLRAARTLHSLPILGVNSLPGLSVGALCQLTVNQIDKMVHQIESNDYTIEEWPRIKIELNDTVLPFQPINDVLFSHSSPAATSRYQLIFNGKREWQKSSGVWISTPAGSTGASYAAGGRPLVKRTLNKLQYVVREPFDSHQKKCGTLIKGRILPRQKIAFVSNMMGGRIFCDGYTQSHEIQIGDTIKIGLSPQRLKVVDLCKRKS